MTKQWLYLIGAPGVGKTTLLQALVKVHDSEPVYVMRATGSPLRLGTRYNGGLVQVGYAREAFGGTDALPMNVQPLVLQWAATTPDRWCVAEGDRLANHAFFVGLLARGWGLTVAWLDGSVALTAARQSQRGSHQHPAWVKGRRTKVARLAAQWTSPEWHLDATQSVSALAAQVGQHPVFQALS